MNETQIEKAQRLVDEGRVKMTRHGHFFDDAQIHCDQHTYLVTLYSNAPYNCTCGWGVFRTPGDDVCVHAEAVKLAIERAMQKPSLGQGLLVVGESWPSACS